MTKRRPIDLAAVRQARTNLRRIAERHPELIGPPSRANRAGWENDLEAMMGDEPNDAQFVLRLPTSILDRVDAFATKRRKDTGENVSRADAMRLLLVAALDAAGTKRATAKKTKR